MLKKTWITVITLLLATLCLSLCCAEGGENPIKEAESALQNAATAEEQLAILYDVSIRCSDELETGGWETSLTCQPAERLPEDLLYTEDTLESMERGDLTMEDLADAKIICLFNDDRTIRLLGDFQVRIPEKNRAATFEEADTVVYLLHNFHGRSDYIGSAYNRYYTVYVFRRGENSSVIAGQRRTTPPVSGRGTLTGESLPLSEIWESARPFFYGTMEMNCPEGKATYRVTGSSCCLAGLDGEFVRYEIPDSVEGYPVTGIEAVRCDTLEELVLPEGIIWIGDIACYSLRSINFPLTLRRITGSITLDDVEHVNLNEGLEEIGDRAFYSVRGEDFTLPSTLKSLGKRTLCNGVECPYIIIPDGVTFIPDGFLGDSPRLISIFIPAGVTKIEGSLNYGRSRIYTPAGSAAARWAEGKGYRWTACETAAEMPIPYYGEENGFLYGVMGDETMMMRYIGGEEDVRIPETLGGYPVTVIRSNAFSLNNYIRSIVIPESAQKVQDGFICDCWNVKAIYVPDTDVDISFDSYMMTYYVSSECCIYVPAGSARALEWAAYESSWLRWGIWTPGMEQAPEEEPFAWTAEQREALQTPGASVTFGVRQPEEGEEGGPEPIEWTVLACEEGRSLLITRKGLYLARFSEADNGPTSMSWRDSTVRGRLQRARFDGMFTHAERAVILPVEHDGMPEKIFLLSIEEAEQYFATAEGRICTAVLNGEEEPIQWWLRTKGTKENNYLAYIWADGTIDSYGGTYRNTFAVRPAVWVRTE